MVDTEDVKKERAVAVLYSQTWWGVTQADHTGEALDVLFKFVQAGAGFVKTPWANGTGDGNVVTANCTKAPLALNVARPKKK